MKILKLLKRYFKVKGEPLNSKGVAVFKKNYNQLTHWQKGLMRKEIDEKIKDVQTTRARHIPATQTKGGVL